MICDSLFILWVFFFYDDKYVLSLLLNFKYRFCFYMMMFLFIVFYLMMLWVFYEVWGVIFLYDVIFGGFFLDVMFSFYMKLFLCYQGFVVSFHDYVLFLFFDMTRFCLNMIRLWILYDEVLCFFKWGFHIIRFFI